MEWEKKSQFEKELNRLLEVRRNYAISLEDVLQIICNRERLKLKKNKRSFNIRNR